MKKWKATLYLGFLDFEKAIPEKLVRMVRLFYDASNMRLKKKVNQANGSTSTPE